MYFSRICLRPGAPDTIRSVHESLSDNAYRDHQLVWRFFSASAGTDRNFLFHRYEASNAPCFYTVSPTPPQPPSDVWDIQTQDYPPEFEVGQRLRFDLRVNPVTSRKSGDKSRRHDVVMDAKKRLCAKHGVTQWHQLPKEHTPPLYTLVHESISRWLLEPTSVGANSVACRCGFAIAEDDRKVLHVDAYRQHPLPKMKFSGYGRACISTVDISGVLTVIDAERFTNALTQGIGPAKAFGCGLLLVRRAD